MPRKKRPLPTPFVLWISEYGIKELAKALKVTTAVVQRWKRMDGHPTITTGAKIVRLTNSRITLNDIYAHLL